MKKGAITKNLSNHLYDIHESPIQIDGTRDDVGEKNLASTTA